MYKYIESAQKSISKLVKNIKKPDFLNSKRNQAILSAAVVAVVAGGLGILAILNDKPTTPVATAEQADNGSVLGSSTTSAPSTTATVGATAPSVSVAPATPTSNVQTRKQTKALQLTVRLDAPATLQIEPPSIRANLL